MPIDYTYTPGGASLTTSGGSMSGVGGGMGDMSWLIENARLKAERESKKERREAAYRQAEEARKAQMFRIQSEAAQSALDRGREQQPQSALDLAKEQAQIAQYKAISEPPPLNPDRSYGLQIQDKLLSGAQRQAYLPQNAGVSNEGMSAGEEQDAKAEAAMRVMREEARLAEERANNARLRGGG